MPQMAKNAITPMTVHMTMLFILHVRFVLSKGPIPHDGAHYALFPLLLSVGETTEIKFRSNNRRKKIRRRAISYRCAAAYSSLRIADSLPNRKARLINSASLAAIIPHWSKHTFAEF